jgi:ATP/maltotriose-dependent transcriptional regulator MalT
MKIVKHSLWLASLAALPLAACNQASAPASMAAVTSVTPSTFHMPEGSGCKGDVDRYRAVMDNDLQMGHVNASVYNRVAKEIDQASSACSAGQDARAVTMINATKSRYGYR